MNATRWKYTDASTFCLRVTDGTHDSPKSKKVGKPLITSKHIKGRNIDFENAYLISEDEFRKINMRSKVDQWDVLISMIGEYCGYCYVERNSNVDYVVKNVGIFKVGNQNKAEWLYYYLNSPEGKKSLASLKSGTSQPYLSLGSLRSLQILVPGSEEEMQKIVSLLSALDDKIELNRQTNATLEAMAQAIFKEWFVDFNYPGATGELVDSELGLIPVGWRVGRLDDVLVLQRGFDLPSTKRTAGEYPVLAASGPSETHNEFMVKGPGVTTGRSGVLGKVFYVHENFWPLNTSLWVKEFKNSSPLYAFHLLQGIDFKGFNAGSAVPTLNRNHVHSLPALLPPMEIIHAFDEIICPLMKRQKANEDESAVLIQLRDSLLPKLMRGEIEI